MLPPNRTQRHLLGWMDVRNCHCNAYMFLRNELHSLSQSTFSITVQRRKNQFFTNSTAFSWIHGSSAWKHQQSKTLSKIHSCILHCICFYVKWGQFWSRSHQWMTRSLHLLSTREFSSSSIMKLDTRRWQIALICTDLYLWYRCTSKLLVEFKWCIQGSNYVNAHLLAQSAQSLCCQLCPQFRATSKSKYTMLCNMYSAIFGTKAVAMICQQEGSW